MKSFLYVPVLLIFLSACTGNQNPVGDKVYTLPYVEDIIIDGNDSDWVSRGLGMKINTTKFGELCNSDCQVDVKWAWSDSGLYFCAGVQDDFLAESKASNWQGDGFEFFISSKREGGDIVQYLVTAGLGENPSQPSVDKFDYRTGTPESNSKDLILATSRQKGGYCTEVFFPFQSLEVVNTDLNEFALNFYVNDLDEGSTRKNKLSWHYNDDAYIFRDALMPVKFGKESGEILIPYIARAYLLDNEEFHFLLFSNGNDKEEEIRLRDKNKVYGIAEEIQDGQAVYELVVDSVLFSGKDGRLSFVSGDRNLADIDLSLVPCRYVNIPKPNRFENDIRAFEREDEKNFPQEGSVLFVGSSSIRMWNSLEEDFEGMKVIKRGFGGSTAADVLHFYDRIITPYKPAAIVYFEGSNDLGAGLAPEQVVEDIRTFIEKVQADLPDTRIIILSVKVSISRKEGIPLVMETNKLLEQMVNTYEEVEYIDVHSCMLEPDGMPKKSIFLPDNTHMNRDGYRLWTREVKPVLDSVLSE